MHITKDSAVTIEYTLKDTDGNLLDSSQQQGSMTYIHGNGQLLPALEEQLFGKEEGDSIKTTLEPADGYGEYDETLIYTLPNENSEGLEPGMHVQVDTDMGPRIMFVQEINAESIILNGNHPLAGVTLDFSVEVVTVREATEDELNMARNSCGCGSHHGSCCDNSGGHDEGCCSGDGNRGQCCC